MLLAFGVGSYREISRFGEAKRAELEATAQVLAVSVAPAVAEEDRGLARQALYAIGRIPDIRFAEIRDTGGTMFAYAGMGAALTSVDGLPSVGEASLWHMLTQGSFVVTSEIVRGGRQVGTLSLLVVAPELAARLMQTLVAALLSAGAAILIGLLVAARLQRAVTQPLHDLTQTMNDVRQTSDFARRAERKSDDETGQLVDAFNDMLDQIARRDTALEEHREGLERTVAERTSDLVEARDEAEAANRAKSDFLATMSHEIRTPMNGMLVMAELLAGTELSPRPQRYAETIVRSGQTLLAIINDILDLSKIEAGKLELEQGRVNVETIVDDVLNLFWEQASSKGVDLAGWTGGGVPAVIEGDPVRISQVLSNLVNNALKFTESGEVMVSVEAHERGDADQVELAFAVKDTGIGIPADKVDHIFDAFSQADHTTTRRFGGTGLGLSICQRLVTAMGGRIWAESEPGRGSTFRFTIGARALEAPAPLRAPADRAILVAVESPATRDVLEQTIGAFGFTALAEPADVSGQRPEVVFASPGQIPALRRRSQLKGASVVCVTGIGDPKAERLLADGLADGVLLQPITSSRVREILGAIEAGALSALMERQLSSAPLPSFAGIEVLVADDSAINREVVSEALARLHAHAITVEDGRQAVEAFMRKRFDVVLMDCSMPELDGFAATRGIRVFEAESGRERTPIVALTAHIAGGAADDWRQAGMDDYLTKPFTIRGLADCLARLSIGPRRRATELPMEEPGTGTQRETDSPLDPGVLDSLHAIAGGDANMLVRIFDLFLAHAPTHLAGLKQAIAEGDLKRIASDAHALKSPSLNIGALKLGALCSSSGGAGARR